MKRGPPGDHTEQDPAKGRRSGPSQRPPLSPGLLCRGSAQCGRIFPHFTSGRPETQNFLWFLDN